MNRSGDFLTNTKILSHLFLFEKTTTFSMHNLNTFYPTTLTLYCEFSDVYDLNKYVQQQVTAGLNVCNIIHRASVSDRKMDIL